MINKEKGTSNFEVDKVKLTNDYKFLLEKLRSIKEMINLLEKNFLKKEI